jgi:multiple sugar transport system ATP-binding protein
VTIGIRAGGLRLASDGLISGRVRALEFHGHEWLAHVEAGVRHVNVGGYQDGPPPMVDTGSGGLVRRVLRTAGILADPPAVPVPHGEGTHRRADLVLRLRSRSGLATGDVVRLAVDTDRMLLFGRDGRRVGPLRR